MALLNLMRIDLQQWNATIYVSELILTLFSLFIIVYTKTDGLEVNCYVAFISESHIEIKIKFLFSHFFVVPY